MSASGCIACLDGRSKTVLALRRTADWLEAVAPSEDVSPSALSAQGGCFACLTLGNLLAIKVQLLADIAVAQGEIEGATPGELAAASGCWACLSAGELRTVEVASTPNVLEETVAQSMSRSGAFASLDSHESVWIEVVMLSKILLAIDPESDVDPGGIIQRAGCFVCLPLRTLEVLKSYLTTLVVLP